MDLKGVAVSVRQQRLKGIRSGPTSSTEAGDDEVATAGADAGVKSTGGRKREGTSKEGKKLPLNGALPSTQ